MIDYLRNILPRIQSYSKALDFQEQYVDKPWVLIDGETNIHEYEFCRDNRLIMSVNGQVQIGRWEYRESTKRLLIERPTDKILLKNAFIDDGLMILKKSGTDDPAFLLVNQSVIPDLDYQKYLEDYIVRNGHARLIDNVGQTSELQLPGDNFTGTRKDAITPNRYLMYENGKLVKTFYRRKYLSDKGFIFIEQEISEPYPGDPVFLEDGKPAEDGTYIFNDSIAHRTIFVVKGYVTKYEKNEVHKGDHINFLLSIDVLILLILFTIVMLSLKGR